jgi:hypothetical protein
MAALTKYSGSNDAGEIHNLQDHVSPCEVVLSSYVGHSALMFNEQVAAELYAV